MSLLNRTVAQLSSRIVLTTALLLAVTGAPASAWMAKVCVGSSSCSAGSGNTFNTLQAAFDYSVSGGRHDDAVWIHIQPGLHQSSGTRTFQHSDWRRSGCQERSAYAAFLLSGRSARTYLQGNSVSGGDLYPQDTVLWGKIPSGLISGHGQFPNIARFHGLALVDNTAPVYLSNLSVSADGGYTANGAGDASIYVHNSVVHVNDAVVLGNKGASNCLLSTTDLFTTVINGGTVPVYHDQEGILVDGPAAELYVRRSAVGGNIHTGIMTIDGGFVDVKESVVRGNGWDGGHFQTEEKGHGVTSFFASCYGNKNTEVDVYNSLVTHNTGHGVYLRGQFAGHTQRVDYNDLMSNGWSGSPGGDERYGLAVEDSTLTHAKVQSLHNDFASDSLTILMDNVICSGNSWIYISEPGADLIGVSGCPVYQTSTSNPGAWNQSTTRWNRLLDVNTQMQNLPASSCPSF